MHRGTLYCGVKDGLLVAVTAGRSGEALVTTCEYCGADAVDQRGVCQNCGRLAADASSPLDDDLPSLGETRAASLPPAQPARTPPGGMPPRTTGMSRYGSGAAQRSSGPQGTARYCGTCGARVEPGEAFCGQCGSPVGAGADYTRDMTISGSAHYPAGATGAGAWGDADGDALTEAYDFPPPPVVAPYNRGGLSGGSYAPARYGVTPAPPSAASRTNRTIFGLLCLLGSLISAAGAVYLAIAVK